MAVTPEASVPFRWHSVQGEAAEMQPLPLANTFSTGLIRTTVNRASVSGDHTGKSRVTQRYAIAKCVLAAEIRLPHRQHAMTSAPSKRIYPLLIPLLNHLLFSVQCSFEPRLFWLQTPSPSLVSLHGILTIIKSGANHSSITVLKWNIQG